MSKILFVTNTANKIGSFSIASINAAHKMEFEFYMAAFWNSKRADLDTLEKEFDVKICHVDMMRSPYSLRNFKALKQLVKIIRDEKIDYIHCNTPTGGILGRLAGKKCNVKKVIYQVHGFHFYKGAPKKNWLLYYPIEKLLARWTDALITINQEDYELAKSKLKLRNDGKVYYVPGVGIDTTQFEQQAQTRAEKRKELNIPTDAFVLISVGELNANKNNKVVISALEKLNRKDVHYVLCGIGDLENDLRTQAAAAGLTDNVHFLGYRTDVKELYGMADCFVMPSFREGLSRSIMEAMSSGLPCIVSKIRGNVDLIDENEGGFLCDPTDSDRWCECLKTVCENESFRDSARIHNKEKIKKFDSDSVQNELVKIYRTL